MSRFLSFVLILLLIAVGVEAAVYFSIKRQEKNLAALNSVDFKIIQKDANDKEGRTAIYQGNIPGTFPGYKGKGYIVAFFDHLEPIPNSKDKYLILHTKDKDEVKYRLLAQPAKIGSWQVQTKIAWESLDLIRQGRIDESSSLLGPFSQYQTKISKLLAKGDAVVIVFHTPPPKEILKDENQVPIALWVVIRRNKTAKQANI